ncbi:MAG: oxygen-independent coproporphyrinogen III oxidase [Gammaproteobacteria bacterium]|nr:oxygen-independent coproporphyrinogen III oxidase [Gammaproteobacteria bacterium]MDH4254787.1 oxygen-independent coproporphyrinogen III oxidase [Gammaproteobacteria bacterium]MDH5311324.1 oxygen-independent coproporphyrinogen III oxidase [Gammaproteobacteria bacterium]
MDIAARPAETGNPSICFDMELVSRYGGRGPRYTSYPTALQFDPSYTLDDYRNAARESNTTGRPLSLYVHVPFCESLCYYCGCNKIVTRNAPRIQSYVDHLHEEIRMQAELFDRQRVVEQLHFGGGTPTYLTESQLGALVTKLATAFRLEHGDSREFSIEVDPRSVHNESMSFLAKLGFNRLSLGIQDFDPYVQQAVNRVQSAEDVERLVDDARQAGYGSISFDLIYGLPHQSVASFDRTLGRVIQIRPDRLAVYNYAHLPERFKAQRLIREEDLPSGPVKLEILQRTIDKLTDAGYVYIGMDHFALPDDELVRAKRNGTLQRNFQGYSTHGGADLVALGVSGIGHIGNHFAQNSVKTAQYEDLVAKGRLPVMKGVIVDDDDLLRADVIQAIMCQDGLVFDRFDADHGTDFRTYFADELSRLAPLVEDDLVQVDEREIRVTPKGRLLLRNIAMVFDRYLSSAANDGRFSKAI